MEAPLLGLRKRDDKASKLHHVLQIDIYKEDCKLFDLFLIFYCVSSIIYKTTLYSLHFTDKNKYQLLHLVPENEYLFMALDFLGGIYWIYGLYLTIEALTAYSFMRSKDIKSSGEKLKVFTIIQTIYFVLNEGLISFYLNQENFGMEDQLLVIGIFILVTAASIFITLYFYSQKLGLAEEIQRFDYTNKDNAAYHKASQILDI